MFRLIHIFWEWCRDWEEEQTKGIYRERVIFFYGVSDDGDDSGLDVCLDICKDRYVVRFWGRDRF